MQTHDIPQFWLNTFTVELSSASPHLYGNSRQQAELRLTVEVNAGQLPLTPAQLASLTLVLERPDGTYDQLPHSGGSGLAWWQTTERDPDFDLMPGANRTGALSPPPATAVSKMMYVSTSQPGGSNVKLRARIQKDENTVYYTDDANGFDSYVTITTVRPPYFGESDYEWQKTYDRGSVNNVFLHEYSLRLKHVGLSPRSTLVTPGMIRWHINHSTETYATFVGMARPGDSTIIYDTLIDTGPVFEPATRAQTQGRDSLILVLNGADNIPFNREGLAQGGPCEVVLVDRHGNDHTVRLSFAESESALERRTKVQVSYPSHRSLDALNP
ncbi:hypothetical protein SJI00_11740 [Pseudomonas sp. RP23018S]|uniref:hypothetical protein n=1 Tax=Pseudomonas sp. RP23018S TaxID=3096037 RepID=UPI002ACA2BEB|nr:hypothetical protein [Pseudomonas sp. RP23018S]MDZ5603444.1 hypothetical protein [Pseudomonas sp. RP23018S]